MSAMGIQLSEVGLNQERKTLNTVPRVMIAKEAWTPAFPAHLHYQQGLDLNPPETRFHTDTERDGAQSRTLSSDPCIGAEEIRPEFESLKADLPSQTGTYRHR